MMKLLKIAIFTMVMVIAGIGILPTVSATDLTTEPTTEITTELTTEPNLEDTVVDAWEEAKTYVVGSIISLISGGLLTTVAYIVISKGKKSITDFLNKEADDNKISRATADKLIVRTNNALDTVSDKVSNLENAVVIKLDSVAEDIKAVVEEQRSFMTDLNQALQEYFEE